MTLKVLVIVVDYYTYQIKANQAKLDYLIKMAKAKGIQVDMINDMKYSLWDDEEAVWVEFINNIAKKIMVKSGDTVFK